MQNQDMIPTNSFTNGETTIIKTDTDAKNGQDKCPKCGSTDIMLNPNTGKLRCNFCRHEFEPQKLVGAQTDLSSLEGQVILSGATDISSAEDAKNIITLKCSSCGAEVVIDTSNSTQARCHWCRNTLSINQQVPNGSIPDVVLPFGITKEDAKKEIEKFVGKRKFFAHPKFKQEFSTENIMGVYLPYMLIDINSHVSLTGLGEHQTKTYYRNQKAYYDADLYHVEREFDLIAEGLTIESSADKLNHFSFTNTNNVINAIMPFDLENCVKFNSNYLRGYTSEKRDTNVSTLEPIVSKEAKDVARFSANSTLKEYDRGVSWSHEEVDIKGTQWKSAYLPVWLYSYLQVSNNQKVLHYVAVNARTKETMGSVPIYMPKLIGISILIEILGILTMLWIDFDYNWAFLFAGIVYFFFMFFRYRNANARHKYETETKTSISNLRKVDQFVKSEQGLSNSKINGVNNTAIHGSEMSNELINKLIDQNGVASIIKNNIERRNKK